MLNKEKLPLYLFILLMIFVSFFYLWSLSSLPITAYDESIYAQVTRDTMGSGQILTLKHFDQNWFEKPPLYFWLSMPLVKIFGDTEIAYRLISSLSAISAILLCFLLVKKLTNKTYLALLSAFIFSIIPFFYITSRQVRLDTPLSALMLATVYLLVLGWRQNKKLIYVLPIIALGFLLKSFAILVVIPILFIFSFIYKKWDWLKNKWLWYGLPIALIITLPWHIYQYMVWGQAFLQKYIGWNIISRVNEGFSIEEKINHLEYFNKLWAFAQPWWQIFLLAIVIFLILNHFFIKNKNTNKLFWSSLITVAFGILFFSFSKTKITTYLIPIFPYLAIVIALGFYALINKGKNKILQILYLLILIVLSFYSITLSMGTNDKILKTLHFDFDYDLKEIGLLIKNDNIENSNIYFLGGPPPDVVSYYSKKQTIWPKVTAETTEIVIPPKSYILIREDTFIKIFTLNGIDIKPEYINMRLRYIKNHIILLYTAEEITI